MMIYGGRPDTWGIIPSFLDEDDPRCARDQIHAAYIGGWNRFEGFKMNGSDLSMTYTGDPPLHPLSCMIFRNELLIIYDYAWVAILQGDGTFEMARLD